MICTLNTTDVHYFLTSLRGFFVKWNKNMRATHLGISYGLQLGAGAGVQVQELIAVDQLGGLLALVLFKL